MADLVPLQEYLLGQPSFPEVTSTDPFFHRIACRLREEWDESGLMQQCPAQVRNMVAIAITGYFQDSIADSGLWRAFITFNRRHYGRTLPYYTVGDDYIDCELNQADVRFMTWYAISMNFPPLRDISPLQDDLLQLADLFFDLLQTHYDEAPMPAQFRPAKEIEIHNPEDQEALFSLAHWLFLHSYLLTPSLSLTFSQIFSEVDPNDPDRPRKINDMLERAMMEQPAGPVALFIREWIFLIIENRLPPVKAAPKALEHKYYRPFMAATGGQRVAFFDNYPDLNDFFIRVLGWEKGVEHLDTLKDATDITLFINPEKGLLVARDVARCIAAPGNKLYDKGYAKENAFDLLTVRGRCPADLALYCAAEGWLPDAVFPGSENPGIVTENFDFIARCYLQMYYRD